MIKAQTGSKRAALVLGLPVGLGLLASLIVFHVLVGAVDIAPTDVLQSFTAYDDQTYAHNVIQTVRLPRAILAAVVGGALAVAGAIMQGLTRNPLASPDILGINAGAVLGVVAAILFLGVTSPRSYAWFGFGGGTVAALVVYTLGSIGHSGPTPARLTITGALLSALFGSLTNAILLLNEQTTAQLRFWLAGSTAGRDLGVMLEVAPYLAAGLVLALILARQITTLSLGEDIARGLGQNTRLIQILSAISVILLAGASVALAGPVGFVGLVIPHMVRMLVGADYRWILPYSLLGGAMLMILADVGARLIVRPSELPVGVVTALIGAPVFVYLARWKVSR
jgi:iron complex transport system permease protein